jgi:ethanolamine utilization protein EutN
MILGRVMGDIVATIKHPGYAHRTLLVVERITPGGSGTGSYIVAVDAVGAGVGETVLVIDEGSSARQILGMSDLPIRSLVVGIVDEVDSRG